MAAAYGEALTCISLEAGSDLSASQYRFVTLAADGQVDQTGAGLDATGILQDDPDAAGVAGSVAISGVSKVVAGAATTRAGNVASDSTGRAVNATTGNFIQGIFLEAAAAAGDIVPVLLIKAGRAA